MAKYWAIKSIFVKAMDNRSVFNSKPSISSNTSSSHKGSWYLTVFYLRRYNKLPWTAGIAVLFS